MVDNHNLHGHTFGNYKSIIDDQVSGFTLAGIESTFLKYVYGLSSLREKVKENKPIGVNDEQINKLMYNF